MSEARPIPRRILAQFLTDHESIKAFEEMQTNAFDVVPDIQVTVTALDGALTAHIDDTVDAHNASAISNVPAGSISATTVQAAIDELDASMVSINYVSNFPELPSAATVDIFGAAGATISINNSTPVTLTDFTDCTSAQVGSVKRVIPVQAWTVTASANMTVDGATSGNTVYPAGALLEVMALTTSTFAIRTVVAHGSGSCAVTASIGSFTTVAGVYEYTRKGREISMRVKVTITTNGTAAGGVRVAVPIANGGAVWANAVGAEVGVTGLLTATQIGPASNTIGIIKLSDYSYMGGNGYVLDSTINYRA